MSLINLWILYVTFVDIIMLRQAQFPIINYIGKSVSRTREYLQALIAIKMVLPEGGNKNRTYSVVVDKTVKL